MRRPELVAATGEAAYREALHYASIARQLLNYHASVARPSENRIAHLLGIRDAMMADNLAYTVARERGRGRVFAFAHNSSSAARDRVVAVGPELARVVARRGACEHDARLALRRDRRRSRHVRSARHRSARTWHARSTSHRRAGPGAVHPHSPRTSTRRNNGRRAADSLRRREEPRLLPTNCEKPDRFRLVGSARFNHLARCRRTNTKPIEATPSKSRLDGSGIAFPAETARAASDRPEVVSPVRVVDRVDHVVVIAVGRPSWRPSESSQYFATARSRPRLTPEL